VGNGISPEFVAATNAALEMAKTAPDDAIRYMATSEPDGTPHLPIFALPKATEQQAAAGGCPNCTYLGLWADAWPGYPRSLHGTIWLFEDGIRQLKGKANQTPYENLVANTYQVLTHEMGHALQRDHVLDEMQKKGIIGGQTAARGCGTCPGRS